MEEKNEGSQFLAIGSRGERGCDFRRKSTRGLMYGSQDLSPQLRAMTSIGTQQRYRVHPSFLTDRTEGDVDATDPEQLFLPGLFAVVLLSDDLTLFEDLTT